MADPKRSSQSKKSRDFKSEPQHKASKTKAKRVEAKASKFSQRKANEELPLIEMEDEGPDFPRGRSVSNRLESEGGRAEEFDAEENLGLRKRKRPRKSYYRDDDDLGSLFGEGITGKLPRFANKITLKNISPGMKLWGVITEINEKDLTVSLPGGLRGFVRAEEASDLFSQSTIKESESSSLCNIFNVGQLVSCVVLQVEHHEGRRKAKAVNRIWLSLRLGLLHKGLMLDTIQDGMVLMAYVESIEDHGHILRFGSHSFSGFLPKSSQVDSGEIKMNRGQLIQVVVTSVDKARGVVYLRSDPDLVSASVTKDLKGLSIDLLVPGMMVNARVQSTLQNGIMLSFLTYFTGTVDIFNVQNSYPSATWKEDYAQNMRVRARILFVDPTTRAVGLTLNPHLVRNKVPPTNVKVGDIYDNSRVVRVDRGFGLLLEVPSNPGPTPAYVPIFDVADVEVKKLEKKFKEGRDVRVRVLGFRQLEGLAMGTLKASAFGGSVFTHSDVKPGMVVKAKILAVDSFGAIVQFSSGVKALCPLQHMSEFDIVKPKKKFKVGAELPFRVLGCKSKRITVTHKKTLLKSKLTILASYSDATNGLVTHGWISKVENHGCFVRFFNGVQGFAHRSELGIEPGNEISSIYHVGQGIKCRVINSVPALRRINLSFTISPERVSLDDGIAKLGSVISGVVERVTPSAVLVHVSTKGFLKGTVFNEHLADHQGQAALMKPLLKPGYEFNELLVLDIEGNHLILSAKYSLIEFAKQLPLDAAQIHPNSVVHGYMCNIIETGCFVRFLGRFTGFSPKNKATDNQMVNLSEAFYIGQSVRSHILNVDRESGKISLSLKQSSCFSTNASFIQGYFLLEDKIAELQASDFKWVESFKIGSVVEGKVQEMKEFGVVLGFEGHRDLVGFISRYQLGGATLGTGSVVQALVIDISKADGIVDLSLRSELLGTSSKGQQTDIVISKKKRKRETYAELVLHQIVNAVVQIVKENYLVLSILEYGNAIGYAFICDYNTQMLPHKQYVNGQSVVATVEALPSISTTGRLLLLLKSLSEDTETSRSKRAKKKSSYTIGSLVEAEITDINPIYLRVKFGIGLSGRVHITEVADGCAEANPLSKFRIGQLVTACIVEKAHYSGMANKNYLWELSVKPSLLAGTSKADTGYLGKDFNFSVGELITAYVFKVDNDWVWLSVSRHVKCQMFLLDTSTEPSELEEFQKRFTVGQLVSGYVLSINKEKKLLRLKSSQLPVGNRVALSDRKVVLSDDPGSTRSNENAPEHIFEGDILGGRVTKILPGVGGLLVQIGPHLYGKVHFTELTNLWVSDPLSGYQEGQFVKCRVIEISRSWKGTLQVDLSLRNSLQGTQSFNSVDLKSTDVDLCSKRWEKFEELQPNMEIQGYVKTVTPKGCFIFLSRQIDARILLSNLSDRYIEKPENEFPVGKLVCGRVVSVDSLSKRVDVTLKAVSNTNMDDFRNLNVGDVISGRIKRVESYGLFILIDHTNLVGLCHISEISDDHIDSIETKYRAGERVLAKILKVNKEQNRISLGMKPSYIGDEANVDLLLKQKMDNTIDGHAKDDSEVITEVEFGKANNTHDVYDGNSSGDHLVFAQAELRASVLPLNVILDDGEESNFLNTSNKSQDSISETENHAEKSSRHVKKKAREQRELEIRAAEERLLNKDAPKSVDEFEKSVRSSPNSSFVWINYMAFMLSLADVEKARSIAERALKTINFREENEKMNIWVALFNLENEYGSPREEAVTKTFERALQYCDPKKLHLALLGMYERTEQNNLAEELLNKMVKRFKKSCKVWLRLVQNMLKQGKDGVKSVVNRAVQCLPPHKHIKFLSHTAILEFQSGDPNRGRSMFETILKQYPKRTDLWSVYLDQEIRIGDADVIRALFERATSMTIPSKKMKFLFKKYLAYETSHGDEERIEYVKKKAMDYVESSIS